MYGAGIVWLAGVSVLLAGSLWGLYWIPVRALAAAGWSGALGSIVIGAVAGAAMLPVVAWRRWRWRGAALRGVLATALGGSAFMLYSVGIVEARVAIVILLFYLTPVWTTLLLRFVFGQTVHPARYAVIVLALLGLALTLGRGGFVPLPEKLGEWYGLLAGLFWSLASIGMSRHSNLAAVESTFVFILGALLTALILFAISPTVPTSAVWPPQPVVVGWALAAALLWWIASMMAVVWATRHLDPARIGMLLMSEVVVGVVSAALFAGEHLAPVQLFGGAILMGAVVLDVVVEWLSGRRQPPHAGRL